MWFVDKIHTSMIDYPGQPSLLVYTLGCNLKCVFCHNKTLIDGSVEDRISIPDMVQKLTKRIKMFDHITITGGEPCMHPELIYVCQSLKGMGYKIKLDTNGLYPNILSTLVNSQLVDYVAMDIKTTLNKYGQFTNSISQNLELFEKLRTSIDILRKSVIQHEYRTTATKDTCTEDDFINIAQYLFLMYQYPECVTKPIWYLNETTPIKDEVLVLYTKSELEEIQSSLVTEYALDIRLR
jgi:pyruvate formate lyase activating enzyme